MVTLNEIKVLGTERDLLNKKIRDLRLQYLNQLVTASGFKEDEQIMYRGVKGWIVGFKFGWKDDLAVILYKVKKDGTNGKASLNAYGASIESISKIKE